MVLLMEKATYINHSCDPNSQFGMQWWGEEERRRRKDVDSRIENQYTYFLHVVTFNLPNGPAALNLISSLDIKKGEEITITYMADVTESPVDQRQTYLFQYVTLPLPPRLSLSLSSCLSSNNISALTSSRAGALDVWKREPKTIWSPLVLTPTFSSSWRRLGATH